MDEKLPPFIVHTTPLSFISHKMVALAFSHEILGLKVCPNAKFTNFKFFEI
jgi:hypothetical protein